MAKNIISDAAGNALHSAGLTQKYEDTSFVVGETGVIHNVNTDLGYNGHDGYFVCDGAGNLSVSFSPDGVNYGDSHLMKSGESISLLGLNIDSIKVTWIANSAYRIFVA